MLLTLVVTSSWVIAYGVDRLVPPALPFRDPSMPWSPRVHNLVSSLTLEEKVAQLAHYDISDPSKGLGWASSPAIRRLGIDPYNYGTECNTGYKVGFPQNIGMAATFNRTAIWLAGRSTGLALRADPYAPDYNPNKFRGLSCWSPMINIMRHPLWGRNHEGYGEDPYLSGEMTEAVVRGMQGEDPRYVLINAGCKHFAAFDGPGNAGEANISGVDWYQTYLPQFKKCFDAGALSTMCTYAKLNGSYGCQDPKLLTTYLRDYMKFDGYVVSDLGAIHDATAAIHAGCDLEDGWGAFRDLINLTHNGSVKEGTIDQALRRVFYARFRHGEFDPSDMVPYNDATRYSWNQTAQNLFSNVSLQVTQQSIALLKNDGQFLPLRIHTQKRLALFGCLIRESRWHGGNVSSDCQAAATAGYSTAGGRKTDTPDVSLSKLGYNATFVGSQDSARISSAASNVDVAIVFIGRAGMEGENGTWCSGRTCGDNANMTLPPEQYSLMEAVLATRTPVVIVFFNCNPLDVEHLIHHPSVRSVVHAFYPEVWAGRAVADVLAGVVSPAGRMPYSWPRNLKDSGEITDYVMTGTSKTYRYWRANKTAPLFPFGYGLSFTSFKYSNLQSGQPTVKTCENITLSVVVTNTGQVDSDEVVQVYVQWKNAPSAPQRQLVGFERVNILAGASKTLTFVIQPYQLAIVYEASSSTSLPTWMSVPADVDFSVGGQQPEQEVSADSNVLAISCSIVGNAVAVDSCGSANTVLHI